MAGSLKLGGLFTEPIADRTIADCVRAASIIARNRARLFARETGRSVGAWRCQALLLVSLSRLAAGEPVTHVALDLGYDSPRALTAMFRRTLGVAPSRYVATG